MFKIRDKAKRELISYLKSWIADNNRAIVEDVVDDILNPEVFPGLAIVDRKAGLPTVRWVANGESSPSTEQAIESAYRKAYAGYVKEVKDG